MVANEVFFIYDNNMPKKLRKKHFLISLTIPNFFLWSAVDGFIGAFAFMYFFMPNEFAGFNELLVKWFNDIGLDPALIEPLITVGIIISATIIIAYILNFILDIVALITNKKPIVIINLILAIISINPFMIISSAVHLKAINNNWE